MILLLLPIVLAGRRDTSPALQSPALAAVADALAKGDGSAVARFWTNLRNRQTPLVEPIDTDPQDVRATFLWRDDGTVRDVVLMAQPDGVAMFRDPRSHLEHLPGTDIWYRTHTLPRDAEFSYIFSVNPPPNAAGNSLTTTFRSDPLNPLQYRILNGPLRSIARMPDVPANPWIARRPDRSGAIQERRFASARLQGERQLWVYATPAPMQDPSLLILLDGRTCIDSVPAPQVLDNLYAAGRIPPTIAVFVKDGPGDAWQTDMYFSDGFVDVLATELVPSIEREYHFTAVPSRTVIGGDSIAGSTAAFAALRHPDVFGRVLAQSASFWLNNHDADEGEPEWVARQFMRAPKSDVTFWIDVGRMEIVANESDRMFPPFVPGSTSLLAANRHLRDVLRMKGYTVEYVEDYGAHEPLRWTRDLPQALIASLGR